MRKTLLMLSAALVTVLLAGAASAGPFSDSVNKRKIGPYDKASNPAATPPKLGVPIPSPAPPTAGPKIGPYDVKANPKAYPKPTKPGPNGPIDVGSNPPGFPPTGPKPPGPTGPTTGPTTPTPMPTGGYGNNSPRWPVLTGVGLGFGAVTAAAVEYASPYQTAPVAADPYATAPVAGTIFDEVMARLNLLNDSLRQGLIGQDEYRSQRPAILAALDAGQVARSVGIQPGLRQLKAMADAGYIDGREYDQKRREFAQFI